MASRVHSHVRGCQCHGCLMLAAATSDGVSAIWITRREPADAGLPASEQPDGQPVQGILV